MDELFYNFIMNIEHKLRVLNKILYYCTELLKIIN